MVNRGRGEEIYEVDMDFISHAGHERFDQEDAGLNVGEHVTEETSFRDQCVATSSDAQPLLFHTMPKPYAELVSFILATNSVHSLQSMVWYLSVSSGGEDWRHFKDYLQMLADESICLKMHPCCPASSDAASHLGVHSNYGPTSMLYIHVYAVELYPG